MSKKLLLRVYACADPMSLDQLASERPPHGDFGATIRMFP
jgi:hypothetical protein